MALQKTETEQFIQQHKESAQGLSQRGISRIQQNPTTIHAENADKTTLPSSSEKRRRKATWLSTQQAHGATADHLMPAVHGLFNTFIHNCSRNELQRLLSTSPSVQRVTGGIVAPHIHAFEASEANTIRSVAVLYLGGILSKKKYRAIYSASIRQYNANTRRQSHIEVMPSSRGLHIPRLVPYHEIMKYVRNIDIGTLLPVAQVEGESHVEGYYRPLKTALTMMAAMFLSNERLAKTLNWFGKEKGQFQYAIGGDGAPVGEADADMTLWCVSIINRGRHVGSPNDNFLLLAAGCKEEHPVLSQYAVHLKDEIEQLNGQEILINGVNCSFACRLLPVDMKWLAMYSGELPNSATYFTTFANVQHCDITEVGVFGKPVETGPQPRWTPWSWKERVAAAEKVHEFKCRLRPSLAEKTKRSKVLEYMSKTLHTRQEFYPLLGRLIEFAKAEPLHIMNNSWQHVFELLLMETAVRSNLPVHCKSSDLPQHSPIKKLLSTLQHELKLNMLRKKIEKWLDDGMPESTLHKYFRFRGRESRACCHHILDLLKPLKESTSAGGNQRLAIRTHVFCSILIHLRNATALFSRYTLSHQDLQQLRLHCTGVFNGLRLWFASSISPTIWVLRYIVPAHAEELVKEYGFGLGLNTAQGREAKVLVVKRFFKNSLRFERWQMLFVHEFMSTIWLRQRDPVHSDYHKGHDQYCPKLIKAGVLCQCGAARLEGSERCAYCSMDEHKCVEEALMSGSMCDQLNALFKDDTFRSTSELRGLSGGEDCLKERTMTDW